MKIAYIIGGLPFGGVETLLFDTVSHLKNDPEFETLIINVSGVGDRMSDFTNAGFTVRCAGNSKKAIKTYRIGTIKKVRKILEEFEPDLIHTTHFAGDYFGRLAARKMHIPIVTHIQNPRVPKQAFRRFMNKFLSRYTKAYLSVSKEVQKYVEQWHKDSGKAENILMYNAVEDSAYINAKPADLSEITGQNGRNIITVGRLVKEKNYDGLIAAFSKIKDRFFDTNLIIVGEGTKRAELEQLIDMLGLQDRVFLAGYKKNIPELLKGADIFALVSHSEGFGTSHLEAMFAGLPSVISENVPTQEICEDSAIISTTEPDSIAERLSILLEDKDFAEKMGKKAKAVSAQYTMNEYMKKLIDIYKRLAKK